MSSEVIVAVFGLIGIIITNVFTYIFTRRKNAAEVGKLKAETDKINAEAEKIRTELNFGKVSAGDNRSAAKLPKEFGFSYIARREALTQTQGNLLKYMVKEGYAGQFVTQDTLEKEFSQFRSSELFYRLECLRLLGFLERENIGQNEARTDRFAYRISEEYRKEIGDLDTLHSVAATT